MRRGVPGRNAHFHTQQQHARQPTLPTTHTTAPPASPAPPPAPLHPPPTSGTSSSGGVRQPRWQPPRQRSHSSITERPLSALSVPPHTWQAQSSSSSSSSLQASRQAGKRKVHVGWIEQCQDAFAAGNAATGGQSASLAHSKQSRAASSPHCPAAAPHQRTSLPCRRRRRRPAAACRAPGRRCPPP